MLNNLNNNEEIIVFTDGACSHNGYKKAAGGIGIYIENNSSEISLNLSELTKEKPTNNVAELLAILTSIKILKDFQNITIKSDSMYSINCIVKWSKNWSKNNWKTSKNKDVLNKSIIQEIVSLVEQKNIKFKYVKAHTQKPNVSCDSIIFKEWFGNDKADKLAVKALAYSYK